MSPPPAAPIDKVDKWGKRRLAYRVEKHREGSYVLMQFTAEPGIGEGIRAPSARAGLGDQVPDRAHRRDAEAPRQAEEGARKARARRSSGHRSRRWPADAGRHGGSRIRLGAPDDRGPAGAGAPAVADSPKAKEGDSHGRTKRWKTRSRRRSAPPAATKPPQSERSNISGARKFAVSASRRSTTSITKTCACCRPSSPSAARSCRGAFPASARRISAA